PGSSAGELFRQACLQEREPDRVGDALGRARVRMPRYNEEEKKQRTSAIQSALEKATDVPLRIVRCSLGLLEYTNGLVKIANPNLVTDVGVAGLLANAALKGAMLNVEINLNCIQSKEVVNTVKEEIEKTLVRAEKLIYDIMKKVKDIMHK
ncbi:hypothetical protein LCGC14_1199700, partial [marine sediment metagenome]